MLKGTKKKKMNGVVYTPEWIVKEIIRLTGYSVSNNSTIIDPACGDGAFLMPVVNDILDYGKENNLSKTDILNRLNSVYGIDIDKKAINVCKNRLNALLKDKINIDKFEWKLLVGDSLSPKTISNLNCKFDYVVGNPPYVRIQNLPFRVRNNIQKNYTVCLSGSTDIYLAFFELGINLLNANGKLGYITPNTYIKTKTGKVLRDMLLDNNYVDTLVDFGSHQVFENATTYSLITILNKAKKESSINIFDGNTTEIKEAGSIESKNLNKDNWILKSNSLLEKVKQIEMRGKKLGDIARISTGIATLADDYFIFKNIKVNGDIATITAPDNNTYHIEASILRPIIKASKWKGGNIDYSIIFPYRMKDGETKYSIIPENIMKKEYPKTLNYFKSIKNVLQQRDRGKKVYPSWYAFGRSQGINSSFGRKILTSTMNLKPNFLVCEDQNVLFYAGYAIFYDGDVRALAEKLNSDDMEFYISNVSRVYQHNYRSYAKSFIENFGVEMDNP